MMIGNASVVEMGWCLFALYGIWYAVKHYLLVRGDRSFVTESKRNGLRLALVKKDLRSTRERLGKLFLCLVAGVIGILVSNPVSTQGNIISYASAACFIGILLLLVIGTRQDVKDRERIFASIIRSREEADNPLMDDDEAELGSPEKPMQVEVVQPPGGPVPVEIVDKEEGEK
jgi:hypothetical protein